MSAKYYVLCDNNCKYEGMTKEQILTAIMQAVSTGTITDVDAGFVTTLKTIDGKALRFFWGTRAEYDKLPAAQKEGLFALITDDTTAQDLLEKINGILSGDIVVPQADYATSAGSDGAGNPIESTYMRKKYLHNIVVLPIGTAGATYAKGFYCSFSFMSETASKCTTFDEIIAELSKQVELSGALPTNAIPCSGIYVNPYSDSPQEYQLYAVGLRNLGGETYLDGYMARKSSTGGMELDNQKMSDSTRWTFYDTVISL